MSPIDDSRPLPYFILLDVLKFLHYTTIKIFSQSSKSMRSFVQKWHNLLPAPVLESFTFTSYKMHDYNQRISALSCTSKCAKFLSQMNGFNDLKNNHVNELTTQAKNEGVSTTERMYFFIKGCESNVHQEILEFDDDSDESLRALHWFWHARGCGAHFRTVAMQPFRYELWRMATSSLSSELLFCTTFHALGVCSAAEFAAFSNFLLRHIRAERLVWHVSDEEVELLEQEFLSFIVSAGRMCGRCEIMTAQRGLKWVVKMVQNFLLSTKWDVELLVKNVRLHFLCEGAPIDGESLLFAPTFVEMAYRNRREIYYKLRDPSSIIRHHFVEVRLHRVEPSLVYMVDIAVCCQKQSKETFGEAF